jgi:hypothetical protein
MMIFLDGFMRILTHFAYYSFRDNFALFKDDQSPYSCAVVWITDIDSATRTILGYKFQAMKPSYEDDLLSYAVFHSYVVSQLSTEVTTWNVGSLLGKGTCLFLGTDADMAHTAEGVSKTQAAEYKQPTPNQHWFFELLDHCIDFSLVKEKPAQKRRRKRKREEVFEQIHENISSDEGDCESN